MVNRIIGGSLLLLFGCMFGLQLRVWAQSTDKTAMVSQPAPGLSDRGLADYYKSQFQLQKALADQYLSLLNALQQTLSSQLNAPKQDAAAKEAALRSECGKDATLAGLEVLNPRCVPNPPPTPTPTPQTDKDKNK